MLVNDLFNFNRRDVLATRNDHVFGPIGDLDVAAFVYDRYVAGMEPATGQGLGGGVGVLEIAHHHSVAAQQQLTGSHAVVRDRLQAFRVGYHQPFEDSGAGPLSDSTRTLVAVGQQVPAVLPDAAHRGTRYLGDAVHVIDVEPHRDHGTEYRSGRRRASGQNTHGALQRRPVTGIGNHRHDDRRGAEVIDTVVLDRIEDGFGRDLAQAHVGTRRSGDRPGETPAVGMEHRQRPQVARRPAQGPVGHLQQAHQVGATMAGDHALRITGRTRRVVEGNGLPLVTGPHALELRIASGEQCLIADDAYGRPQGRVGVVDIDDDGPTLEQRHRLRSDCCHLSVDQQHPRFGVAQNEGDTLRIEPAVDGVEHSTRQWHAEVRFQHGRRIRAKNGHGLAGRYSHAHQCGRQAQAALARLLPATDHLTVDDSRALWMDECGPVKKTQWRQGQMVGLAWLEPCVDSIRFHGVVSLLL